MLADRLEVAYDVVPRELLSRCEELASEWMACQRVENEFKPATLTLEERSLVAAIVLTHKGS